MKVRITFYGMVVIELSPTDRLARILAVNATTMNRPYHHPILCAKPGTLVADRALPALPSLDGLLDRTSKELRGKAEGWHLSGMTMRVGVGQLPKHEREFLPNEVRHPKSVKAPWSALKWIPDLSIIQPGAKLKDEYRRIGKKVLAIIELCGGELKALPPSNPQHAGLLWWFSPTCQQACTDLFIWEGDVKDGIRLTDQAGNSRMLKLRDSKKTIDLFFSHEAPALENQMDVERDLRERGELARTGDPRLIHFQSYYDALDKCRYTLDAPRGVWRFDAKAESRLQSDIFCVPTVI
jgi:hypothetical protein